MNVSGSGGESVLSCRVTVDFALLAVLFIRCADSIGCRGDVCFLAFLAPAGVALRFTISLQKFSGTSY